MSKWYIFFLFPLAGHSALLFHLYVTCRKSRLWQKKNIQSYPETTHFWRSFRSTIRTSSRAKLKIRTQKINETAYRCNFRIRKYFKISLWILNLGKIIFRIRRSVGLFTPFLKCYRQLRIKMTHNRDLSNELLRLNKSFVMWVSPLDGDAFVG